MEAEFVKHVREVLQLRTGAGRVYGWVVSHAPSIRDTGRSSGSRTSWPKAFSRRTRMLNV